ncbi:hypothetical protein V8F33_007241 [Rhypophila sp. PSN 637]
MADPLSLSASLAGLIALADSIFRASFKYAKSAIHAKEEAANLATEAQDLAGVLHRLSLRASALELEAPNRPTIRLHHVISCRQLLLRVEKALAKSTADFESPQARHHLKRALKWPFSSTDTKDMLVEIARHRGTLSLALTVDSMDALSQCLTNQETLQAQMATIASGVQETHEITVHIELNDRKRRVLDYFRPVDPQRSLGQCLGLRHPMTGLWLVDGEDFQQWLAVPHSKLWLTGIPGAGKTVLAGAMIAEVLKLSSDSTGIAFFFCEYKDQRSQDPLSILQTMASQLALQNQAAYSLLEEYHKALQPLQGLGSSMSLWRMKEILGQMVSCFEKVYMIIDGLDECGDNAAEVADTLTSLTDDEDSAISLSILSRDEYQIREVLQGSFERVEISAQREDVRLYVATEITSRIQQGRLRLRNMALKDEILHALVDENGGMFRWVACQLDYLCELPKDKDRRQALKSLPPTLNKTYERILERVEKRDHRVRSLVQRCLEYISAAAPPLTISELCEAVSLEADTEDLEEEDMVDETTILEHCSSLVRVRNTHSGDFEIVEFSHFSVAEYLQGPSLPGSNLEKYHMDRSKGQERLAITCLRFISLNQMSWRPAPDIEVQKYVLQRTQEHPFYSYASIFWLIYWKQSDDDESMLLVMDLFNPQKTTVFVAWALQIYYFLLIPRFYSFREAVMRFERLPSTIDLFKDCRNIVLEKNFTTLHMAATLGLSSVCSRLINQGADINAMCTIGMPLHCALSPTWLLPPHYESCISSRSSYEKSSRFSYEKQMLEYVDTSRENSEEIGAAGYVSLSEIAHAFHFYDQERPKILRLFLDKGSKVINSPKWPIWDEDEDDSEPGGLPLFVAAVVISYRIRSLDIIVMLLKGGLTIQPDDLEMFRRVAALPWTPLQIDSYGGGSKSEGHIRNGLDVWDSKPEGHIWKHGASILAAIKDLSHFSKAAAEIYPYAFEIVTSMSKHHGHGASDRTTTKVTMSMHHSISERSSSLGWPGHIATTTTDPALMAIFAAQSNDPEELQRLLSAGNLDINGRLNGKGQTVLSIAVENGSTQAVQFLLRHGCDSTIKDFEGWLPVWLCVNDTHAGILAALLESDPSQGSCKGPGGNTIWHLVARRGSHQLLQVLIEKSVDLQKDLTVLNYAGDSPLNLAAMGENPDVAMLMVDSCPVVVKLWSGKRPLLELAAKIGSMELAQKLVGTGFIDITANTADMSTPLHHINTRASITCVRFLKSLFPDLEARDINGARPLEAFAVNTVYGTPVMGQTAKINQILDELIPPGSSSSSSTGTTFWEQFCFGIAALVANSVATVTLPRYGGERSLDLVLTRLVHTGVISAHEAERKTSAVYPFVSAFDGIFSESPWTMSMILPNSLTTLLGVTNYLEEARNSSALVKCLHKAIKQNLARLVQTLLDRGVDPHIRIDGYNALDTACAHWSDANLDIFDMVLGRVDQNTINSLASVSKEKKLLGPMHLIGEPAPYRIGRGDKTTLRRQMLARLITAGADPNLCTGSNVPTLAFYIKRRNIDLSLYALELGADPGRVDEDGYDALTHAVLRGYVQFISHVRDLERQGRLGYTVQWNKRVDIVWDNKWRGRGRVIPLGEPQSVHAWGRERSNPVFKDCNALHLAALQGHRGVLEFYLREGLIDDIDAKSGNGWTPLHFASYRGSSSMIRCLHRWGADMNTNKGEGVSTSRIVGAGGKRKASVLQTLAKLSAKPPLNPTGRMQEKSHSPSALEEEDESEADSAREGSVASAWSLKAELPPIHWDRYHTRYTDQLSSFHPAMQGRRPVRLGPTLQKAIENGDLTALKDAWMMGARDVACSYCSVISCAVRFRQSDVLDWLTDNGADISDLLTECPFHHHENLDLNPSQPYVLSRTRGIPMKVPWVCAADYRFNSVLPKLLSRYLSQQDQHTILEEFPDTPLNTALGANNHPAARIIIHHVRENREAYSRLSKHPDPVAFLVNHKDHKENSPLYLAIDHPSTARLLIENGAEVNIPYPKDRRDFFLHSAIDFLCLTTVEHLLASGAHINARNGNGHTPLQVAARVGEAEAFHLLLKHGADPHYSRFSGNGALVDCCLSLTEEWSAGKTEILLTLLRLGSNPDKPNDDRVTPTQILLPLHSSRGLFLGRTLSLESARPIYWRGYCMSQDVYIFDDPKFHLIVRAYGKDCLARVLNLHPPAGDLGPLCLAACYNSVAMMENLISIGADIEFEGCSYGTALMAACDYGRLSAVKFLVRRRARLAYFSRGQVDRNGTGMYRSAFQAARQHPAVLQWLLVQRHTEQMKITDGLDQADGSTPSEHTTPGLGPWSGPVPAGMRFRQHEKRQEWESSLDWLAKVRRMRQDLDGKVVVGAELWPDLDTAEATKVGA